MIENVELYDMTKMQLKYLSIEKNTPINVWMRAGARYILDHNCPLRDTPADDTYVSYTMDIAPELKKEIVTYVHLHDAKIRDFWVTVSDIIIDKNGDFQ